jgi:hypothetical protein
MGMFAETANVDYCLLFADQGKQTYVSRYPFAENKWKFAIFRFPFAENKRKQPFSVSSVFHLHIYICIETAAYIYGYPYIYAAVSSGKREPRRFFLVRLRFAHRANGSSSFVRLFTKKPEVIRLQTD